MQNSVLLSLVVAAGLLAQQTPPTAFIDVTVVPMDRERLLPHQTVLVQAGRIAASGPVREIRLARDVQQVDGRGKYLLPGLADMHVHLTFPPPEVAQEETAIQDRLALLLVANGITTVRNMWGSPSVLALRNRIQAGTVIGPSIYTTGNVNDGERPVLPGSRAITTAEQAAAAVAADQKAGYYAVKVFDGLSPVAYLGLISAARQQGLPVYGHVPRAVGLRGVLQACQDSIEHVSGYQYVLQAEDSPFRHKPPSNDSEARALWEHIDLRQLPDLVQATRQAGTWNCPTLIILQKMASERRRTDLRYVPAALQKAWEPIEDLWLRSRTREDFARLRKQAEVAQQIVKELHEGGARLLLGTDFANPFWVLPGFSLHEELKKSSMPACTRMKRSKPAQVTQPSSYTRLMNSDVWRSGCGRIWCCWTPILWRVLAMSAAGVESCCAGGGCRKRNCRIVSTGW